MPAKTGKSSFVCYEVPRLGHWPKHLPNPGCCAAVSPGVRRPRREANHSALSSAELKMCGPIPAFFVCVHSVRTDI
jgi:hypothetical protein